MGISGFGLTVGFPVTLKCLIGENGKVWGLSSFGFSAPYIFLDDKLDFAGEHLQGS
jgi:transketolase